MFLEYTIFKALLLLLQGPSMTKGGSSQRNRGGGATPRKVISIGSITQDVTLHKAESAWKPGRKQEQAEVVDDDTKKTEVIYFQVSVT